MIIGTGNDIVDIRRIEKVINRFGDRFTNRIFTVEENLRAEGSLNKAAVLAKRFAAKEAVWKALGDGRRPGVKWRDLMVTNLTSGKPIMDLRGGAAVRLSKLIPDGMVARIDLAISDEPPWAQAYVVISAEPKEWNDLRPTEHFG